LRRRQTRCRGRRWRPNGEVAIDDLSGWGGDGEGEVGGEEVANAGEVAAAGDSNGEVDTAARGGVLASEARCLQGFLSSTEFFRSFMDN
jgi:hypothetical protein